MRLSASFGITYAGNYATSDAILRVDMMGATALVQRGSVRIPGADIVIKV